MEIESRNIGHSVLEQIGKMAYKLELLVGLAMAHLVFYVKILRTYVSDVNVIAPLYNMSIEENLTYEKVLVEILDHQVKRLRNKDNASIKALWRNQQIESAT